MLPESAIAAYTLDAGDTRPALSLYVDVSPEGVPVRHETRIFPADRVKVQGRLVALLRRY